MGDPSGVSLTGPLILASSSPRRADLLRRHGYCCEVIRPPTEEPDSFPSDLSPTGRAEALSYLKAASVARTLDCGLVIGADTVVTYRGLVFGKPTDRADAAHILGTLAGTTHQVITGVTVLDASDRRRDIRHAISTVAMRALSSDELDAYLDSNAWVGKGGAYGVQDEADAFVRLIDGSFTNVVGLPMDLLAEMLVPWRGGG
jgi:septum formation protein